MFKVVTTLFALLLSANAFAGDAEITLKLATSVRSGWEVDARTPDGEPLVVVLATPAALGLRDVPEGAPIVVYGIEPDEIDVAAFPAEDLPGGLVLTTNLTGIEPDEID